MENVPPLLSESNGNLKQFQKWEQKLASLGYTNFVKILNGKDYGIPQNRERVFMISIRGQATYNFPAKMPLKYKLKDFLEDNVDEKYYLSDKMIDYITATGTKNFSVNNSEINCKVARPLTTDQNKRAGTTNYISNELPENYDLQKIAIKNNTEQGYLLAEEGDGVNISSRMEYQRGNVQKQSCQTLKTDGGGQ